MEVISNPRKVELVQILIFCMQFFCEGFVRFFFVLIPLLRLIDFFYFFSDLIAYGCLRFLLNWEIGDLFIGGKLGILCKIILG